jgi:hypothetical protein
MSKVSNATEKATRPFRWWGKSHYKGIKRGIALPEHKLVRDITKYHLARIKNYVTVMGANRDLHDQNAPDMNDFSEVLIHWGIARGQVQNVCRTIKIQLFLAAIGWLLSCAGIYYGMRSGSVFAVYNTFLIFLLCSVVIVCRSWRLHVLKNEKFVLFKDWLRGRESVLPSHQHVGERS